MHVVKLRPEVSYESVGNEVLLLPPSSSAALRVSGDLAEMVREIHIQGSIVVEHLSSLEPLLVARAIEVVPPVEDVFAISRRGVLGFSAAVLGGSVAAVAFPTAALASSEGTCPNVTVGFMDVFSTGSNSWTLELEDLSLSGTYYLAFFEDAEEGDPSVEPFIEQVRVSLEAGDSLTGVDTVFSWETDNNYEPLVAALYSDESRRCLVATAPLRD